MFTPAERKALKGRAHKLNPVVIVGSKKGLTDEVVAEIERALKAHELIKIRAEADRDAREVFLQAICERTGAGAVQHIGKILVIYRKNDE